MTLLARHNRRATITGRVSGLRRFGVKRRGCAARRPLTRVARTATWLLTSRSHCATVVAPRAGQSGLMATILERPAPAASERAAPAHLYELVRERARVFPWAVALGGQEGLSWKTFSGRQVVELVDRLAVELGELGLREGDRVVLWVPNQWRTPIYLFALWKLGVVVVPFDRETNPEAGARIVESVEPRCVLVGYEERPTWLQDADVVEWWAPGTRATDAHITEWSRPSEELATISFTSGTTGDPKGCMITHANLLSQVRAAPERIPLDPGCRLASLLPLSHLFELTAGMLYPMSAGAAIHYIPSRRAADIARVLAEQHITHMLVVPQILSIMGQSTEEQLASRFSPRGYAAMKEISEHLPFGARHSLFWTVHRKLGGRLRLLACGGAALAPETQQIWERLGVRVLQGYGASECAPIVACAAADGSTPVGSVGKPIQGVEVRVSHEGELLVKGPNVMRGYWKDPSRTDTVLDLDGWYATGDLARIDPDGNIWLLGRARDLIVLPSGMKGLAGGCRGVAAGTSGHPRRGGDRGRHLLPRPAGAAAVHVESVLAVDSLGLVDLILTLKKRPANRLRMINCAWT
jgi:long-chain acyl-CoA synthetase